MDTTTTNSSSLLDSLFGTAEKGFDLWSQWQTQKATLTAAQVKQSSVTDVTKQPSPSAITLDPKTIMLGVGVLAAVGVLIWVVKSK